MMSSQPSTTTLYPPEGFGAPKNRHAHARGLDVGLPPGTEVFSADNHISLADDIFYERFPDELKDKAPRIWYEDGAYMVGRKGQNFLPGDFSRVLMQYDDMAGAATKDIKARIRELHDDGVDRELAFPNAVLALFHFPDKDIRERVFRIYNEVMAELQERSNGHFYGAGLINWWDPQGARRTLSELKSLGLKTFLMPLNPGKDDDGNVIAYSSTAMSPGWDATEVALRIQQRRRWHDDQHRRVPGGVLQVHLRRHPRPPPEITDRLVRGWDRLGPMGSAGCGAPGGLIPAHVQPPARARHPVLLGQLHERVVHGGSARAQVDRRDRRTQGDVVVGLSAQRKHVRLLGEVAGRFGRGSRSGERSPDLQRQHQGFPGPFMTTSVTAGASAFDIPDLPDRSRMYREIGARLRSAMADHGVDALILLNNGNVVYATGAAWPLLDAGLSHVERPAAIVLATDEHPHLFMPFREGAAFESEVPAGHVHPPLYLEFDEGVEQFARMVADLIPSGATVAVDELTGAMHRAAGGLFPPGT